MLDKSQFISTTIHLLSELLDCEAEAAAFFEKKGWAEKTPDPEILKTACRMALSQPVQVQPNLLRPIFPVLKNGKSASVDEFFEPTALETENWQIFPKSQMSKPDVQAIKAAIFADLENAPAESTALFAERLVFVLKKQLSQVAIAPELNFVSAFDWLKTAAAIADCLSKNKKSLLIFGAGIEGIQSFCYDLVSSKAARSMKGRSFYLQLLMDSLAVRLMRDPEICATSGHIIYARGGKMQVILPNSENVKDALKDISKEVDDAIWKDHGLGLSIWTTWVEFDEADLEDAKIWKNLDDKVKIQRRQKHANRLKSDFDNIFKPQEEGLDEGGMGAGKPAFCQVTGDFIPKTDRDKNNLAAGGDPTDTPIWVTDRVKIQSDLGRFLTQTLKVAFSDFDKRATDFGQILKDAAENSLRKTPPNSFVKLLNDTDFSKNEHGFQFYGGNRQPMVDDEFSREKRPRYFHELDENPKFSRLGILRMDLDGLGGLLKPDNFKENGKSIAAYSTASGQLDLFFSGYLNHVRAKFPDEINLVFAGGDDLMAIGRWREVIEFAEIVRTDWQKFNAEGITISGAVEMVGVKYPIGKATFEAGEMLKIAKNWRDSKNAFSLFGVVLDWEKEFGEVKDWKKDFEKLLAAQKLSAGFLQMLQQFQVVKNRHLEDKLGGTKPDLSFIWHSAYFVSRYAERYKKEPEVSDFLEKIKRKFITATQNGCRIYDLLAVAARWVELEKRADDGELKN